MMPHESGLQITEYFPQDTQPFKIIYTTAYNEFAVKAFKTHAVDFLLKPIDPEELVQSTERARKQLSQQQIDNRLKQLEKAMLNLSINKIALEVPRGYRFVTHDEIILFEADGMYTHVYLQNGKKEKIAKPLKHFTSQLEHHELFFKPHRSYLINLKYIREIKRTDGFYIIMDNKKLVPVPRENKELILSVLRDVF